MSAALAPLPDAPESGPGPAAAPAAPPATAPAAPAVAPRARHRAVSLRVLLPVAASCVLAAAQFVAGRIHERHARQLLMAETEARLVSQARHLAVAASTVLLDDFPELRLQPMIRELMHDQRDLAAALVLDRDGVVRGHPDVRQVGHPLAVAPGGRDLPANVHLRPGERLSGDARTWVVTTPVVHASGRVLGSARIAVDRRYLEDALADNVRRELLVSTLMVVAGAFAILLVMMASLAPMGAFRGALERIGRGDLDPTLRPHGALEFRLLADAVNAMTGRLRRAQATALERERLAGEIEIASGIQRALLPRGSYAIGRFVVAGAQRPAAEVGGDYFDYHTRTDGTIALVVADVAGKGVGGSLVMSMLAALLRSFRDHEPSPRASLLTLENELGPRFQRGAFVTVWHGILDPARGVVRHASAGHLPTLVLRGGGGSEWLRTGTVPLGLLGPEALRRGLADVETALGPGDLLLQFTDGISEAAHAVSGEQFGFERVEATVRRHHAAGAEAVVHELLAAVETWTRGQRDDDETVLAVACLPAGTAADIAEAGAMPSAEALLAGAGANGRAFAIHASLEQLAGLREWIEGCPHLAEVPEDARRMLELALYEACANVIEHGYRHQATGTLELWALPGAVTGHSGTLAFLLLDRGRVFDPATVATADVSQRHARRQGRGLGVSIMRRVFIETRVLPQTPHGNLTLMRFDPARWSSRREEEEPDA